MNGADGMETVLARAVANYQACGHCEGECDACRAEASVLAQALRDAGYGHVAAAKAAAWDECSRQFALDALNSATHEAGLRSIRRNPYRVNQIEADR